MLDTMKRKPLPKGPEGGQLERMWLRTMFTIHRDLFLQAQGNVHILIDKAESKYYLVKLKMLLIKRFLIKL